MTFGEKLQKLRRARGLSQEELAQTLSVTRQTISKWELSQSTPELEYIAKLSAIYGVTTDYLIKEGEESAPASDDGKPQEIPESNAAVRQVRYSSLFILGLVIACIGMLGVVAFVLAAAIYPVGYVCNGLYFEGVIAYVLFTKTRGFFLVLLMMVVVGIALSFYGIFKRRNIS